MLKCSYILVFLCSLLVITFTRCGHISITLQVYQSFTLLSLLLTDKQKKKTDQTIIGNGKIRYDTTTIALIFNIITCRLDDKTDCGKNICIRRAKRLRSSRFMSASKS